MAVMILVDRRRLSLDDTLDRLFPGFPAYGARITVRHLLDHTSGLPDYEDLIPEGTTLQLQDRDVLQLLLATEAPVFAPGARFAYSNSGYALLALIVEKASGAPFARFLADEIFRPLGMKRTVAFESGLDAVTHRAYGYQRVATGWRRTDQSVTSAVLGDGGIYSSLDDMARWVRALDGGRLLSRAAHRQMVAPAATVDPGTRYGFGWFVDARYGQQRLFHGGSTIGFTNFVQRFPGRRAAVIVLTNERGFAAGAIGERIADLFLHWAHGCLPSPGWYRRPGPVPHGASQGYCRGRSPARAGTHGQKRSAQKEVSHVQRGVSSRGGDCGTGQLQQLQPVHTACRHVGSGHRQHDLAGGGGGGGAGARAGRLRRRSWAGDRGRR